MPDKKIKVRSKKKSVKNNSTDISLMVSSENESEYQEWNKQKIVDTLIKEASIEKEVAETIANNVEEKIIKSQTQDISSSLIRELIDNELFVLGLSIQLKKQTSLGMPIFNLEQLIFSKTNENSNLSANNPEAINMAISENILKQYALNNVFSKDISDAHLKGRIHLHDLGTPQKVYCSSHSIDYIKKYGLQLDNLNIESSPAKHASTLTGHINTFLASIQAYYAGALGLANVNIAYAPYLVGKTYEEMIQEAQYLIFSISQTSFSRGNQVLFSDFNIHTGIPEYLKEIEAIGPGGKYTGKKYKEYEKEAQMFAKAMMEVWRKGDANGHIFEFPKMDLHINQDTFDKPEQLDLLKFACDIASENGVPYFVFDRDAITLSSCCRLKTTLNISDPFDKRMLENPESMRYCGFQNITINLPQTAYRSKNKDVNEVIQDIFETMEICLKAHLQKKEFISKLMSRKGLPMWQVGKISQDGFPYIDLEKASYIIGMLGLNECVQHLTGQQLHESDDAFKMGLKIISSMFIKINEFSKKYNLKFVLEESPAESAARRMAKIDLKEYPVSKNYVKGDIENDEFYYTNSIHFAAGIDMPITERIEKQSKFHSLIAAGAIIHAFIGEENPSSGAIMSLVTKTWQNTNCAQLTISPEFTICNACKKMTRGIYGKCPVCGAENVSGIKDYGGCE